MRLDNSSVRVHAHSRVQFHFLAVRKLMAVGMSVLLCLLMLCICTETVEIPKDWVQPLRAVCTEVSRRNFGIPTILETSPPETMKVSTSDIHWSFLLYPCKTHHQHACIQVFTYCYFHIIGDTFPHSCNHCMVTT